MRLRGLSVVMLMSASALVPLGTSGAMAQQSRGHQSYEQCVEDQRGRQVAGAVIGGVLGAVIGAELHDEAQDRDRADRRRYDRRHDRHRRHRYDRRHQERGNDGAVVAGAGLGAVAGAAIAGRENCEDLRYRDYDRYDRRGDYRRSDYRRDDYRRDDYRRDDRHDRNDRYDRYGRDDRYDDRYDTSRYDRNDPYADDYVDDRYSRRHEARSDGELLGGQGSSRDYYDDTPYNEAPADSRVYTASSSHNRSTGNCRYMTSGRNETYMCEGTDGIWRPAARD